MTEPKIEQKKITNKKLGQPQSDYRLKDPGSIFGPGFQFSYVYTKYISYKCNRYELYNKNCNWLRICSIMEGNKKRE